jgi:hypothetical protein
MVHMHHTGTKNEVSYIHIWMAPTKPTPVIHPLPARLDSPRRPLWYFFKKRRYKVPLHTTHAEPTLVPVGPGTTSVLSLAIGRVLFVRVPGSIATIEYGFYADGY